MGGGGGTNYAAEQAKEEAKKQAARDAVNAAFGIAPTGAAPAPAAKPGSAAGRGGIMGNLINADLAANQQATDAYGDNQTTAATNKTARDALYDKVRTDVFDAGKTALDDRRSTASRNNKFALFAQGLNGGSADIDENALLDRTYSQGLLDLGAKADAAKSDLRANDESARLGLLQSVDNGMDQGSAMSSALEQMKNSASSAEANAQGTDLGDLFAGAGLLYSKSNAARGQQDATAYLNSLFGPAKLSGGTGGGGIVTRTGV